jgi:hypothetical protein
VSGGRYGELEERRGEERRGAGGKKRERGGMDENKKNRTHRESGFYG